MIKSKLFMTEHDKAMTWIVWRNPNTHFVANYHANIKTSHFSAKFSVNDRFIFEFNLVKTTR